MPQTAYFAPPSSVLEKLTREAVTAEKVALSISTLGAWSQRASKFTVGAEVTRPCRPHGCNWTGRSSAVWKKDSKTLWQQAVQPRSWCRPHDMLCLPPCPPLPSPPLVLSRRTQLLLCRGGVWDAALLWIMCSKRLIKSYDVMLSKLSLATCAPEAVFCITLCGFAVIKGASQLSLVGCRYKLWRVRRAEWSSDPKWSASSLFCKIPDCGLKAGHKEASLSLAPLKSICWLRGAFSMLPAPHLTT